MATIIPSLKVMEKKYGVVVEDQCFMSPNETDEYVKLFPESVSSIKYVDVLEIGDKAYIVGSDASLVPVEYVTAKDVATLFDEDAELFERYYDEKKKNKKLYEHSPINPRQ